MHTFYKLQIKELGVPGSFYALIEADSYAEAISKAYKHNHYYTVLRVLVNNTGTVH